MTEQLPDKVTRLRAQTPEEKARIESQRASSLAKTIAEYAAERPASARVASLRMAMLGADIAPLEKLLLEIPVNWKDGNAQDTEYWIAVGLQLHELYAERGRMQTGRE